MSYRTDINKLDEFVVSFTKLIDSSPDEKDILSDGADSLRLLVAEDDWLPARFTIPHPQYYQQYLLYLDPKERFSIVSFVWGPGQLTPIHNHTVWGLIGVLRGAEYAQHYKWASNSSLLPEGDAQKLLRGSVDVVSPATGDIHQVRNAFDDRVSISIHVYGADIGKVSRSVFYEDGTRKDFVSGYANVQVK